MFGRWSAGLASWTNDLRSGVSQGVTIGRPGNQGNPIDSAVGPVGSYGEAQKDVYGEPLEGIAALTFKTYRGGDMVGGCIVNLSGFVCTSQGKGIAAEFLSCFKERDHIFRWDVCLEMV